MNNNNRFTALFNEADEAFNGAYREELDQLNGLSKEEIKSVTPETTAMRDYSVLTKVVEQASRENLKQAELIDNIKALGETAIKIARKVPKFATLL